MLSISECRNVGVGLVYWPALAPLFECGTDRLTLLELEPQTLWEKVWSKSGFCYRINESLLERVAALPQAKLMHGVGQPLGGTTEDPVDYVAPLRRVVDTVSPLWVSEHLSFNRVDCAGRVEETGFLLPPRQSRATAKLAARNIERYRALLRRPVAFETGVNYLRPREGDLADGEFFAEVAEQAGCGILLDLHNLWCNEQNGRQRVVDVVAQLPLDRVWEIHLAGGMMYSGFHIDAHSDSVPPAVFELAANLIPRLPWLSALVFEVLPEHLPRIGLDGVWREIEELNSLWSMKAPRTVRVPRLAAPCSGIGASRAHGNVVEASRWEKALAALVRGNATDDPDFAGLEHDPGVGVLRELASEFRRVNLARALRYTVTALLAGLGYQETVAVLDAYFREWAPDAFAAVEADHFAVFLTRQTHLLDRVPYLDEVLAFEHALVRASVYGAATDIKWTVDPIGLFEALDSGRLPDKPLQVVSRMRISAE